METRRPVRAAAAASAPQPGATRSRAASGGTMHYLVVQGDVLELVESAEPPDTEVLPGERRKAVLAAYPDRADAEKRYQALLPSYRGVVGKGEAY